MKEAIRRFIIVIIGVIIQFGPIIYIQMFLNQYLWIVALGYWLLSLAIVLGIIKNSTRLSNDLPWIIFIILFPLFGTIVFLTIGRSYSKSKLFKNLKIKREEYSEYLIQEAIDSNVLDNKDVLRYFSHYAKFPISTKNKITYYNMGEKFYPELLSELKKAEKFIFMEYFIINNGKMWNGILDILKEKAQKGVEIRIMYDDVGSVAKLPTYYSKELAKYNIKCVPFNRLSPFSGIMMNNRDHRKMTIIDGKVAFTGGVNISDEYINEINRCGVWKDNGIKVIGESVWSFTVMFLTMWNANKQEDTDILKYKDSSNNDLIKSDGYVVPFGNDPTLANFIGEDVYLNIINSAKKYVYIFTPYLIIDTDMINSLTRAAKRGVDVRLVVPKIADNKIVYGITKSFFKMLIKYGVKIYTYTPGFVHSKVFISDDERAVVGTLNLDYRSLYLHFENGIYLENNSEIKEIKKDFVEAFKVSHLVSKKETKHNFLFEVWQAILRLIAPLM